MHLGSTGRGRSLAAFCITASVVGIAPAQAQSPEQFYKGKTVNVVIGYPTGGGYDFFGRFVARHIGRHIPGNPTVIPQNMPGAGGLKAANYIYDLAPKDGTVLGIPTQVVALTEALGDPGVQYKTAGYTWVGRVTSNVDVSLTWHTKVKTIQEAMTTTAVMAGIGPAGSSGSTLYPMVLNNIVGTKFKLISGYAGANDALIAMERGETDGAYTSWNTVKTSKQDWLDGKKINIIVQYSIDRHPDLPDVPAMIELARTPEDKQVLALYASGAVIGRSVLATPKIPADRVKALRAAFDAMLKDAQFLNEIEKTKAEFDPMSGEQLQKVIEDVANLSPAVLERAKIARGL